MIVYLNSEKTNAKIFNLVLLTILTVKTFEIYI